MVTLSLINKDGLNRISKLKVSEDQVKYMSTFNVDYFNHFNSEYLHYAIEHESKLVGLIVLSNDILDFEGFIGESFYNKQCYFILHFMIEENFQGNGFGKKALQSLENELIHDSYNDTDTIVLFHHTKNLIAKNLYSKSGFKKCNIIMDESEMLIKKIEKLR